ncbi:PH domain-containing protein [Mycobacterium sp.]|uniref:PH domain-containing protein n=1 Tax=Mycobacterium sp. TaxID=1785 RepID=UPI003A85C63B
MIAESDSDEWDFVCRPHWTPIFAYVAAVLIILAHVGGGLALKIGSSGVVFRTADQVAIALLGVVLAGVVLLLTRSRLRVGPRGVSVRNTVGERLVPWADLVGVSFPVGSRWARVDLPDDEYLPVLAIQAVDKDLAVESMDELRALVARYRPDLDAR